MAQNARREFVNAQIPKYENPGIPFFWFSFPVLLGLVSIRVLGTKCSARPPLRNRNRYPVQREQRRGGLPAKSPQTVQPEATLQSRSLHHLHL